MKRIVLTYSANEGVKYDRIIMTAACPRVSGFVGQNCVVEQPLVMPESFSF